MNGTPNDCKPCPCPEGSPCHLVSDQPEGPENPVCTECPEGRRGESIQSILTLICVNFSLRISK